jgi:hypothetical protein
MDEPYYDDDFSESQGNIFPIIIIVGIIIIIILYFAFFRGCKKTEYKKGDKCIPTTECDEQKNQIELHPATRTSDRHCGCPTDTFNHMGECRPLIDCTTDQKLVGPQCTEFMKRKKALRYTPPRPRDPHPHPFTASLAIIRDRLARHRLQEAGDSESDEAAQSGDQGS